MKKYTRFFLISFIAAVFLIKCITFNNIPPTIDIYSDKNTDTYYT